MTATLTADLLASVRAQGAAAADAAEGWVASGTAWAAQQVIRRRGTAWAAEVTGRVDFGLQAKVSDPEQVALYRGEAETLLLADAVCGDPA